jgi:hypothetical protein
MINYNKKHFDSYTHGMKQSKSKMNFIVGENKTNISKRHKTKKIVESYSLVPKAIN